MTPEAQSFASLSMLSTQTRGTAEIAVSRATDNLDSVQVTVCNCRYIFPSEVDITRNFKASTWSTQGFQGDRIYLPEMEKKNVFGKNFRGDGQHEVRLLSLSSHHW